MLSTEVYDSRINQITNSMPIAFPDSRISALLDYTQSHGLRCKQVDGQWHFYKDGAKWSDHIQAYKQPAYSLLVPRKNWRNRAQAKRKRATSMTKFKVGDKVQVVDRKDWRGEVMSVKTAYTLKHEGAIMPSGAVWYDEELEPAKVKLTPEEAWAEVGAMIMDSLHSDPFLEPALLRHRAYAILGGSDIEVGRQGTELHERVKSRLNGLIDRFVKKYLTESRPFGGRLEMLSLGTYKTRGGYRAHVTERGLSYWSGTIEGAGAGGDPGPGVWRDDGRDYYGYDVFDIEPLPPPHPTPVEERERDGAL